MNGKLIMYPEPSLYLTINLVHKIKIKYDRGDIIDEIQTRSPCYVHPAKSACTLKENWEMLKAARERDSSLIKPNIS